MKNLVDTLREISSADEFWLPFKQCANIYYSVSNKGRFSSGVSINPKRHKGRAWKVKIISPYTSKKGYMIVRTVENGIIKYYQLHRIVLSVFYPCNNMETLQVNHIDGNKSNNNLNNLEWCTCKENIKHAIRTGLSDLTKSVSMYSLDGEFIKTFRSLTLAEKETGVLVTNISASCKGKVRQAGGYQWNYEKLSNIGSVSPKKVAENLKTRCCKQVIALQDGKEIYRFCSVLEASNFINKPYASVNISACALGKRKSAYGYKWQYITDLEAPEDIYK